MTKSDPTVPMSKHDQAALIKVREFCFVFSIRNEWLQNYKHAITAPSYAFIVKARLAGGPGRVVFISSRAKGSNLSAGKNFIDMHHRIHDCVLQTVLGKLLSSKSHAFIA